MQEIGPMISGKRIFITGGAGFIGSALVGRLIKENEIVVFDTFDRDALQGREWRAHVNLTLCKGDVLDPEALVGAMEGSNLVVHAAAIVGIDSVLRSPVATMKVNLMGTLNVLEAASRLTKCERVVCFSTSEVFGRYAFRSSEDDNTVMGGVGEARWTYAVSKLTCEHLSWAYHSEYGLPTTVVRPFNVYGPGQIMPGAMHEFVEHAVRGETLQIHGDGTQIRAWCYIDDMIDALMLTMSSPAAIGESFNIGNPNAIVTVYGLAKEVIRVLGSSSKIQMTLKDYADVELRVPSVHKARELLGFQAKVDLEDGIRRTAEAVLSGAPR